jgi:hypothetical protein
VAVPMLMYGSECWAMNKADRRAVEATKMKFLRYIAGYARNDHACNGNIRQKINILYLNDRMQQHKKLLRKFFTYETKKNYATNFTT